MQKRCFVCMEPINDSHTCSNCGFDGNLPQIIGELKPGTLLKDRYYIGKIFSQNSSSTVYIGYDEQLKTKVFVRRFTGEKLRGGTSLSKEELIERFLSYSKSLASINLCNILPRTIDIFELDYAGYSVTEFFDGESLKQLINSGIKISNGNAFKIAEELLKGIKIMHHSRIMFGAISPESLYILKNGDVRLFGMGSPFYDFLEDLDTKVEFLNPSYAAPELFEEGEKRGSFCDVYSVAAILYRILTDTIPPISFLRRGGDGLINIRKINKNVKKDTETAILNALNWQIEKRTKTAEGFLKELSLKGVKRKLSPAIIWADVLGTFQRCFDILSQKIQKKSKTPKDQKTKKDKKTSNLLWLWITVPAVLLALVTLILIVFFPGSGDNTSSVSGEGEGTWYYGSGSENTNTNSNGYFFGNGDKDQNSSKVKNPNSSYKVDFNNSADKNSSNGQQSGSKTSSTIDQNKVECPDLIGYTLAYAKNTLENAELKLGKITYKDSPDYLSDYVMEQSITVGAVINKGSVVDIVVCKKSETSEENAVLPDVKGKNMLTATQILKSEGFKNVEYVFVSASASNGVVTNVWVNGNSTVTLSVAGKKAVVQNFYGKTLSEIKNNYSNIIFEVKTEDGSPPPEDALGDYKVISQSLSAGTVGYEGMTVTLTVALN